MLCQCAAVLHCLTLVWFCWVGLPCFLYLGSFDTSLWRLWCCYCCFCLFWWCCWCCSLTVLYDVGFFSWYDSIYLHQLQESRRYWRRSIAPPMFITQGSSWMTDSWRPVVSFHRWHHLRDICNLAVASAARVPVSITEATMTPAKFPSALLLAHIIANMATMQEGMADALLYGDLSAADSTTKKWYQVALQSLCASQYALLAAQTGLPAAKQQALKASTTAMQAAVKAVDVHYELPVEAVAPKNTPFVNVPAATACISTCAHDHLARAGNTVVARESYLPTLAGEQSGTCRELAGREGLPIVNPIIPTAYKKGA